jgi:hypothetical protein
MVEFAGPGLPLTQRGIDTATTSLGVEPAALWAVLRSRPRAAGSFPTGARRFCSSAMSSAASPRIATMPTILV